MHNLPIMSFYLYPEDYIMSDTKTISKTPINIEWATKDVPGYPEDLKPFPENYTIYLPTGKYFPLTKVVEAGGPDAIKAQVSSPVVNRGVVGKATLLS